MRTARSSSRKAIFTWPARKSEKTGESTYLIKQGELTTCGWDRPSWTFTAKDVDVTVEGYATAKGATFHILGHSVLYLPWSVFPVKTERQSGVLMPELMLSSRDGTIVRSAYYWAISKDTDATFFLDWIQQRGVKPGVEYRYFLKENIKGSWYASIIDDTKYGHTRYQIKGEHQQTFSDMTFKTRINHVSDADYLKDLGRTVTERSENSLKSTAFLEKPFNRSLLTVEGANFDDLSQPNNRTTFKYVPFASYFTEYMPILRNRLYADLTSDFTNFYRQEGAKATRLTVQPTVRLPYSTHGLNFLGSAGISEKAYYSDPSSPGTNETKHHESYIVEGDANAQFLKNTSTDLFKLGQMQSVIMPRLRYTYIANSSFKDIPSIDPADRVLNTNTVVYSFNHYLNAIANGAVREISLIEISQAYGLSGNLKPAEFLYQGSGERLSDITARFTLFPHANFFLVNQEVVSIHGQGLTSMTNSVHYGKAPLYQVDVAHNYVPSLVNEAWVRVMGRWKTLDGMYQIRYSLKDSTWVDTLASLMYRPKCWSIGLILTQTRRPKDTSIRLSFNLEGLTQRVGGP